jgi:hypothetical protein
MTSVIRKSGHSVSAERKASRGFVKAVAKKPAELKISSSVDAIAGSSSTTKILVLFFSGIHLPV